MHITNSYVQPGEIADSTLRDSGLQQTVQAWGEIEHDFVVFSRNLLDALINTGPQTPALKPLRNAESLTFWRAKEHTPRPDFLHMKPDEVDAVRDAHEMYLEWTRHFEIPFRTGQQGIVSTAGGAQMPIFVVTLRMLRKTGCTLPVELFVGFNDHDPYLCNELLPSLNARCIQLEDYLGQEETRNIARYQYKIFAIIFSSFEDILFLDADDYPVANPERLFTNEPYISSGLVTWPDFWASSASKHLFEIQNRTVPPMNDQASTESGQLLVSKRSHGQALLMAMYYNFYGPNYYYPLMSQGGPGEGDKETFIAGAQVVNAPYYQVKKCVDTAGYSQDGHYHGVAMLQYDPVDDYDSETSGLKPRLFALHHNYPKLDPVELFSDKEIEGAAVNHATGEYHRLLGEKETTEGRFGWDVEEEMWEEMRYVACDLGFKLGYWHVNPSRPGRKGTCELVQDYQRAIFGSIEQNATGSL